MAARCRTNPPRRLHPNHLPPFLVRALARTKARDRGLTDSELAAASGLSRRHVARLARLTSWDCVTNGVWLRFCHACGVNPFTMTKAMLLRRRKWWTVTLQERVALVKRWSVEIGK